MKSKRKPSRGKLVDCDVCGGRHKSPSGTLTEDIRFRCLIGQKGWPSQLEAALRQVVSERDKWSCQRCGTQLNLQLAHVIRRAHSKRLKYDADNVLMLCRDDHVWFDSREWESKRWFANKFPERAAILDDKLVAARHDNSTIPRSHWWELFEEYRYEV